MQEHPIEGLMITAMNSIQDMVDVNTIIGDPIEMNNNTIIIPISKVSFGFAAGGSEFKGETIDEYTKKDKEEQIQYKLPFGGGAGAGVNITPIGFLVVGASKNEEFVQPRFIPVEHKCSIDKLLDYIPDLFDKLQESINKAKKKIEEDELNKVIKKTKKEKIKVKDEKKEKEDMDPEMTYEFEYDETKNEKDNLADIEEDDVEDLDEDD